MKYTTDILLPVSGSASYLTLPAKQGDSGSRFLRITLMDETGPAAVPQDATVTLSMTKPDQTSVWNLCTVENGQILAELTAQMLAAYGRALCDVNVFDPAGTLLSSSNFALDIEKSARKEGALESTDEFTAMEAIAKALATSGNLNAALGGKKVLNFGDSVAAGDGNKGKSYAHLIAEREGMDLKSYALGGATFGDKSPENASLCILSQIKNAEEQQADFILLQGGLNDCVSQDSIPTGTVSDGYDSPLDETTFCGALESALKTVRTKWPAAQLVLIICHKMSSRPNGWPPYAALMQQIAEKWSVPTVDLYASGGLNPHIEPMRTAYTNNADGTHPNESGYLTWYVPRIEEAMRSLTLGVTESIPPEDPDSPYTGTFQIPGVIPDKVQKISQYTVNGKTSVSGGVFVHADGAMAVANQTIDLPELAEWDNLTAQANGAAIITRATHEPVLLSGFHWGKANETDENLYIITYDEGLALTDSIPHTSNTAPDDLMCTHLSIASVPDIMNGRVTNAITASYKEGVGDRLRVRIDKSVLTDAGKTADLAGWQAWIAENNASLIYKLASPATEQSTLTPLTATSGVVTLSGGYKGGTMSATAE